MKCLNIEGYDPFSRNKEINDKVKKIKEEIMQEYEVVRPFLLIDVWEAFADVHDCDEFQEKWGQFLNELTHNNRGLQSRFSTYKSIKKYNALYDNLHHLEANGFIQKIKKDVVLKPGMKLKSDHTKDQILMYTEGYKFIILKWETAVGCAIGHYYYGGITAKTLDELNNKSGLVFKVVEDES